jgi:NAD(P)-dependent dehydrogenase (short-subunit alcohol dehydrogenase family)
MTTHAEATRGALTDKVVVITGAGSGIGTAMAEAFHAAGAKVVVADITGQQEDVAKRLGDGCVAVHADVTKGPDIQAMLDTATTHFGRLDVVCNNAGIDGDLAPTGECSEENYDRVMAVNARGVFLGMRYAIPVLVAGGGGSIINTASIASTVAFPTMAPYCASKGAILMMTKTAAAEYAAAGLRINCICPGVTQTALVQRLPAALIDGAVALTPMGRVGQPDEMAGAAVFLASDAASFITGSVITLDGGYTTL